MRKKGDMRRMESRVPGLVLGVVDGGGSVLERRVLRLLEGSASWGKSARVVCAGACVAVMAAASVGVGMVAVRGSVAQEVLDVAKLPAFDAVTIKPVDPKEERHIAGFYGYPGGRVFYGGDVKFLVEAAFNLQDYQLSGVPEWGVENHVDSPGWFEINATPPEGSESLKINLRRAEPTGEQRLMLQRMLRERFGLKYHFETHEGEVYRLTRGSGEPKLTAPKHPEADPRAVVFGTLNGAAGVSTGAHGEIELDDTQLAIVGTNTTMDYLALRMSRYLQKRVINETGIAGSYDFMVPADAENHDMVIHVLDMVKQLGLRLERGRGPVETLVIDKIERPTEN